MATRKVVGTWRVSTIVEYCDDNGTLVSIRYEDTPITQGAFNDGTLRGRRRCHAAASRVSSGPPFIYQQGT